jgi:hypothetical protein
MCESPGTGQVDMGSAGHLDMAADVGIKRDDNDSDAEDDARMMS